jgi:cell division protein FtsQ
LDEKEEFAGIKVKPKKTGNEKKRRKKKKSKKSSNESPGFIHRVIGKIKYILIVLALIIGAIIVIYSPMFNIKSIEVEGNERLSKDKIIEISGLKNDVNMFKYTKIQIVNSLTKNAYIESVEVTRKLPGTIGIKVTERHPTYMLQFADSFVYINNQGYILEISNERIDTPIIVGFKTDLNNIKPGNRVDIEDLKQLNMVIKIIGICEDNDITGVVTKVDVSNPKNYTLILEGQGKTVYLGDGNELTSRILYLKAILESSEGKEGIIFLNVDLNTQKAYFRPTSN